VTEQVIDSLTQTIHLVTHHNCELPRDGTFFEAVLIVGTKIDPDIGNAVSKM